jgi:TolA-binding protein
VQDKSDNVMELIGTLAGRMNSGMHLPAAPRRSSESGAAAPTAGAAVQAGAPTPSAKLPMKYAVMYGKALDLTDRGDKTRAVELFGAVLKDFPDFEPAKKARARLTTGG